MKYNNVYMVFIANFVKIVQLASWLKKTQAESEWFFFILKYGEKN